MQITTDKEALTTYLQENSNHKPLFDVCHFISAATANKEGAARPLQDELINGLIERINENGHLLNNVEGEFLKEMIHAIMSQNIIKMLVKAKKRDTRIEDVELEDMQGEAYEKLDKCILRYDPYHPEVSHFKTYVGNAFKHFGTYYINRHPGIKDEIAFTDLEKKGDKDPFRFEDHHADHRERDALENIAKNELTAAVRELIAELQPKHRDVIEEYIKGDREAARQLLTTKYGISRLLDQHINQALRALQVAAKNNPRFKDIASPDRGH